MWDLGTQHGCGLYISVQMEQSLGRKVINFPSEKDQMYRVVGRIRRFHRELVRTGTEQMELLQGY